MEPWLDSLSEDWKSEHQSSSPATSLSSSRQHGSVALSRSQSRIPHLARNMRKESGSFLRHRSTRGQARAKSEPVLRERSASSLNLPPAWGSQKQQSLPRRPSSVFSESQNSVQHNSQHDGSVLEDTPEWKKRLGNGEDVASDGFDLFSPTKLEGIFKQPAPPQLLSDNDVEQNNGDSRSWKPFTLPSPNFFPDQYSSVRYAKSRLNLEVLEEVSEEESERHDISGISSDLARAGSLRGLVKQRVQSFEHAHEADSVQFSARDPNSSHEQEGFDVGDPRWRTVSGQEELKNEFISPVTMSKQNSIRATIIRDSVDIDIQALKSKLQEAASSDLDRPGSSSSDRDVSYGYIKDTSQTADDEPLPDLTSQSLPDDLSMGTQDFVSQGGFINSRRGGRSNEGSFLHKNLSFSQEPSRIESYSRDNLPFHSSPPQHSRLFDDSIGFSRISASAPVTPEDTSVVHHAEAELKPVLSTSPLKLFGNRDTYTNNKLMRILSHFEEPHDSENQDRDTSLLGDDQNNALRMSQFGKGDLDGYGFAQEIPRPSPVQTVLVGSDDRIFKAGAPENDIEDHILASTASQQGQTVASLSGKDRTTKRRKTVLKEERSIQHNELEVKVGSEETAPLAGKKRKDARPGDDGTLADPEVLATRNLLHPKSARRQSVNRTPSQADDTAMSDEDNIPEEREEDLREALAAELATFAHDAAQGINDSRKPSLATRDYMEEANKVMQFIRSRGKPVPILTDMSESGNVSELNPDAILDLDIDADSTKDDFSRPPSRDRTSKPLPDRRHAQHDSRTASYLKKYQDQDDLEALTSTSIFGTLAPVNNKLAVEAARIPVPDEVQESSPPNIRILHQSETMRKRKYSTSTVDGFQEFTQGHHLQTQHSANSSTQHTFPTTSSVRSGQKGIIASGTVSIPDHVGTMTFDHEKRMWVKKGQAKENVKKQNRRERQTLTEEDPFEDIPDLSIDEQEELQSKAQQVQATTKEMILDSKTSEKKAKPDLPPRKPLAELEPEDLMKRDHLFPEDEEDEEEINRSSLRSRASEHEAKLHNGVPSKPPVQLQENRKQARVVTIAFSSPVVSGVNYANISDEDFDALPREEDLPLDDSEIDVSGASVARHLPQAFPSEWGIRALKNRPQSAAIDADGVVTFQPRTISPIEEQDEETRAGQLSVIHVNASTELTPAPPRTLARLLKGGTKASSVLCLTPLSDFSVHQIDSAKHPDRSYVEERKHPDALRQAHGSLALAVDQLVKAITDAVPEELYWEQLRRISLAAGSVSSVHGLKEYCPVLEELVVAGNGISQLGGLPRSLRVLDLPGNMVNDLTSWSHLHNLQYVDVSGNQVEGLDGFSSLVHLRSLKANNNRISNIDGILDLNGLLDLQVGGNDLTSVDFEGTELSRLRSLDLSNNQLSEVRNIHCLPELERLDVSHNSLDDFEPEEGKDLPLRELRLSHNKLEVIDLKRMLALKYLDVDENKIQAIHGLSTAYSLEYLSVRGQTDAPNILGFVLSSPSECREIRLSSNAVTNGTFELPPVPQNNLRELEIAACGIAELPEGFGVAFPNCRKLNANFNAIKDITPLRRLLHLRHLLLGKNRINKLRRTCLVLSRLAALEQVDLRDNPLTVGFYSPLTSKAEGDEPVQARYHLPQGSPKEDATWMKVLDEVTGLRRRTIELLLADHCGKLMRLDGLSLCRERLNRRDETWGKLTGLGVLVKPDASVGVEQAEDVARLEE